VSQIAKFAIRNQYARTVNKDIIYGKISPANHVAHNVYYALLKISVRPAQMGFI
jgi:hypothetical protein